MQKVSVIIPVYNVNKYIHEAIDSIINQTYPHLEIIIIDDGSTDGSGHICDCYSTIDNRIKVIHTKNRGLSAARNTGIKKATGEIMAFLDADDSFVPDAIEKAVRIIEKQGVEIVSYGYSSLKTDGVLRQYKKNDPQTYDYVFIPQEGIYNSDDALRMLFRKNRKLIAVWCMIYKASLWGNFSFPEGYVYEDNYVTPLIIQRAKHICMLSDVLVLNRRRKGSITSTYNEKYMKDQMRAHRFLIEYVSANIPNVFAYSDLKKLQDEEIEKMIRQFCLTKEADYRNELRNMILTKARKINGTRLKISIKILGIKYIPHFFSYMYFQLILRHKIV